MGQLTLTIDFDEDFLYLAYTCSHIEHMHEVVWFRKSIIEKMTAMRQFFRLVFNRSYACAKIVHTQADQLLLQLFDGST